MASYTVTGAFTLPPGFERDDLTGELELTIAIADQSGSDLVVTRQAGQKWLFKEKPPAPADGLEISKAQVVWPPSGPAVAPSFKVQGEFAFPGVDHATMPAEAIVTLRLPAYGTAPAAQLVGEETISFDVVMRTWLYFR